MTGLVEGSNEIIVTARDEAGNTASVRSVIVRDSSLAFIPGDHDGNGVISISEVQAAINSYLGIKPVEACFTTDLNGITSIAEVQKVINGYLGL